MSGSDSLVDAHMCCQVPVASAGLIFSQMHIVSRNPPSLPNLSSPTTCQQYSFRSGESVCNCGPCLSPHTECFLTWVSCLLRALLLFFAVAVFVQAL